jgi:tetratricopeptide (TPR) repeat protein
MWTARAVMLVRSCEVAPFVRAEVHSLAATANLNSGNLRHALAAAREAIASYESFDRHRAGVDKIHLGEILFQSGEPVSDVLEVLTDAASEIDSLRAPILHYGCSLNVAYYHLKAHRPSAAEAVLRELPQIAAKTLDLKRHGLNAVVSLADGDYEVAGWRLYSIIKEYSDIGMALDAAILTLYRGEALIRQGDSEKGRREIENAYDLLSHMEANEEMKQAFAQLVVLASRADAAEVIAGIRRQADLMGGCLPLI